MSAGSALLDARRILEALGVQPGDHVADIGSGRTGHFAFGAASLVGDEGRVYAVDVVPEIVHALDRHRGLRSALNVYPLWGDVERARGVDIDDASLDLVLAVHMLNAVTDHDAMAQELRRMVRPGGRIAVIDWHPDAAHPLVATLPRTVSAQTSDTLFTDAGCTKCGELTPSRWHWGRVYAS